MRIGIGFDIHRLTPGDGIILGGIKIPFDKELTGHSDGDALCHAVIDALLGAAALGDIGEHFPDSDPRYKGASSIELLRKVAGEIASAGYSISNIDAVVVAEAPRLLPYKGQIEWNIAEAVGIEFGRVSVKGKTAEGLGPIGAGEALCAEAVALVEETS